MDSSRRTEHLHVVPKADVDRLFKELEPLLDALPAADATRAAVAKRLRGIAYLHV